MLVAFLAMIPRSLRTVLSWGSRLERAPLGQPVVKIDDENSDEGCVAKEKILSTSGYGSRSPSVDHPSFLLAFPTICRSTLVTRPQAPSSELFSPPHLLTPFRAEVYLTTWYY